MSMYTSSTGANYSSAAPAAWGTREDIIRCRGCQSAVPVPQWVYHEANCPAIQQLKGSAHLMRANTQTPQYPTGYATPSAPHTSSRYGSENNYGPAPATYQPQSYNSYTPTPHHGHIKREPEAPSFRSTNIPTHSSSSRHDAYGTGYQYQDYTPPQTATGYSEPRWDTWSVSNASTPVNDQEVSPGRKKANRKRGLDDIKHYDPASNKFYSP